MENAVWVGIQGITIYFWYPDLGNCHTRHWKNRATSHFTGRCMWSLHMDSHSVIRINPYNNGYYNPSITYNQGCCSHDSHVTYVQNFAIYPYLEDRPGLWSPWLLPTYWMGSSKYPLAQLLSVEFPQDFRLKLWLAGYIFWRQPLMDFYLKKTSTPNQYQPRTW